MKYVGMLALALCALSGGVAHAAPATNLDRCISAITGDVLRFLDRAGKCTQKCEDAKRRGELSSETRCRRPSNHAATQACLLRAVENIAGSKSNALKRCTDREVALFYGDTSTCRNKNDTVAGILSCLAKRGEKAVAQIANRIYRPTRPPVCGDGTVSGSEQCDPNAFGTCPFNLPVCHPQGCFCTFPGCGNGIIEFGEDCDYATFPDGCSFNEFCSFNCSCVGFGSPSKAFLGDEVLTWP